MTTRRERTAQPRDGDDRDANHAHELNAERERVLDAMSRDELVALVRRLRWGDDVDSAMLSRAEGAEADNLRLRESQVELAELGARYMDLYEAAPIAYCLLDDAAIITELNLEAARFLAAEPSELRGKPLSRFVVPSDRRALMDHFTECIDRAAPVSTTVAFRMRPGAPPTSVQLVSRALGKEGGKMRGCRTALFDVTTQKRGEESMRVSLRMRDDFLAVVAHDLRSPLAAIVMSAELLERKRQALHRPAEGAEIERIRRSANRMSRLVEDLLDLSSMDAGRFAIEPAHERVESMLVSALEICSPLAAAKQISLSARVDPVSLEAWCDRERVIQALINLLTNAIKFTTTGSVSLRAKRLNDEVHVVVHDTGRGMTRAQIEHAFDPFWRVAPQRKQGGAGLGLSIVKGIVQLHGGRVWVESGNGRGSSFSFTLPRNAPGTGVTSTTAPSVEVTAPLPRPSVADLQGPDPEDAQPSSRALVLLIDDEGEVRESISAALRGEGYEVIGVPHGRAALDYLDRAHVMPALILLDLVMPVMDGWEFLRQQSRLARLSSVPVVLVSAQADSHRGYDVEPTGARLAGYIQKPVRLANLVDVVGACATAVSMEHGESSTSA